VPKSKSKKLKIERIKFKSTPKKALKKHENFKTKVQSSLQKKELHNINVKMFHSI
jgi:DNA replication protein DnaC